jgi:hypothetical protein
MQIHAKYSNRNTNRHKNPPKILPETLLVNPPRKIPSKLPSKFKNKRCITNALYAKNPPIHEYLHKTPTSKPDTMTLQKEQIPSHPV